MTSAAAMTSGARDGGAGREAVLDERVEVPPPRVRRLAAGRREVLAAEVALELLGADRPARGVARRDVPRREELRQTQDAPRAAVGGRGQLEPQPLVAPRERQPPRRV